MSLLILKECFLLRLLFFAEENLLKLIKADSAIRVKIMLFEYVIYVSFWYFLALFLHGEL